MSAVTMGDPAEVVATTPVVGTAMMTAMVMKAMINNGDDGDDAT